MWLHVAIEADLRRPTAWLRFFAAGAHYQEVAARLDAEAAGAVELVAAVCEGREELAKQEAAFRRFLRSLGL